MANLDVDIKIRMRKGTHLVKMPHNAQNDKKVVMNNLLQKIESREQYGEKMQLRSQEEKEIKVELMMKLFLQNVDETIT